MEKLIVVFFVAVIGIAILMGAWWLIWSLWTFVLPQVWPTGPANLIRPGYWIFAAAWTLAVLFGRAVFGRK